MTALNPKIAVAFCALLLLTGCQTYSLVPLERVSIGGKLSIEPKIQWNKRTVDNIEMWTVDGESLQVVQIYKGLEDGDTLFKIQDAEKQENMPKFKETMSLLEIREFIEASIVQSGFTNLKTLKFEPASFAGRDGFRFDFTFTDTNGLRKLGLATGAMVGGKFYLVFYHGAKLHYYGRYLKDVEDMIRTIQLA